MCSVETLDLAKLEQELGEYFLFAVVVIFWNHQTKQLDGFMPAQES